MKRIIAFIIRYVYASVSCLYLFTVGFFFAKNRSLISRICSHFGYVKESTKTIIPKAIIPKVELSEVVPENVSIQIREPIKVDGNVTLLEIVVIVKLIKLHNPNKLFEIGTFDGRTTVTFSPPDSENQKGLHAAL